MQHPSPALVLLVAPLLAGAPSAQSPRPAVPLDSGGFVSHADPSAASEGELSAVLFRRDDEVVVSTSQDRGLTWSAPTRIDLDPTGAPKWTGTEGRGAAVAVADGVVHAVWRDGRNGDDDLYHRRSLDGGASWGLEQRLDKGYPLGTAPVREYAFVTTAVGASTHLHVLFTVDPGAGGAFQPDELFLVSSTDGGTTWGPARSVSGANGSGADVDAFALDAQGSDLVVVWTDDRFGSSTHDDLWLRRSVDAGASFTGPEVQVDPSGPLVGDVENELALASEGALLAIAWEEEFGSVREEAWVTVSPDRGASFTPGTRVGQYPPSSSDVDAVSVGVQGGVVLVGWDDDRTGTDEARVLRSDDRGLTWTHEVQLSSGGGGGLRLVVCQDVVLATWAGDAAAGTGERARAAFSRDGGLTWSDACDLSANTGDVDAPAPAWNRRYGNLIVPWLADDGGTNAVWVGGLRPASLTPVGWTSGGTARIDFDGFSGNAPLVWAVGSNAPGRLPLGLGDGRDLGLRPDATLAFTVQNPQVFAAVLGPDGRGSTGSTALPIPSGTVFHIAAFSLTLSPPRFEELTDVVRVVVR